jgi:metallo-beta-lactamase family protein
MTCAFRRSSYRPAAWPPAGGSSTTSAPTPPIPRNALVFAGYQAAGTRGAALVGGASSVKIHGEWVPVRAEVVNLAGLSAHADRDDLLAWLGRLPRAPRHVFVTHGEPSAADSLRQALEERLRWPASVPEYLDSVTV